MFAAGALILPAQTTKGTFALGLHDYSPTGIGIAPTSSFGIGFGKMVTKSSSTSDNSETKYTSVGLNANVFYFLVDNLSLGAQFSLLTQNLNEQTGDRDKSSLVLLMAGPEVRYYIPAGAKLKFWIKGQAAFGSSKTKYNGESDDPTKLSQYGGVVGLSFFPASCFAIDIGGGYGSVISKSEYTFFGMTEEVKVTESGATLDVGFTVFF